MRQVSGEFIFQHDSVPANKAHRFSDINVSQGRVGTRLWCGVIFIDRFIANFLLRVAVKEFF